MFSVSVLVYICFGSMFCGCVNGYSEKNYALHFPSRGVTDYANIWGMRSLTQFTVCFWMKSSATNEGVPFSYAVPGQQNELLIYDHTYFRLNIGNHWRSVHESANDGRWHHICVTWRNSDGVWQFYKDGALHMHTRGLRKGYTISGGGSLVLGQDQDSLGGSFDSSQSFQGSLTNVNVWSYVLPGSTIKSLSKSCLSGEGNVYKWTDFRDGIKGKAGIVIPSPCYPLSSRR
ncbi:neuronal pentraxin-1-like [Oculina patagonica]